VEEKV
jgi:exodeoxyribonuclease III